VVGRLQIFAESHVSLALGREPSSPRVWLSAQKFFLKNIKIANRCEKLPNFNMTPIRLYVTYKKVF
jgi:hypothetical protein